MSTDAVGAAMAAILDAVTLVQVQLEALSERTKRIEATQQDIQARLDGIDAGQAAVADIIPALEQILGRSIEDRKLTRADLETIAEAIGSTHAAANGNRTPLPANVASDPLFERFILAQPADMTSNERALVDWRNAARAASTAELLVLLKNQYQPSPTDTPHTRALRYRLAAITRVQIEGRGGSLPAPPTTTVAQDRSVAACLIRSHELATLWRSGDNTAIFADPELAGVYDLFAVAERRVGPIGVGGPSSNLVALYRELGNSIETGNRPSLADAQSLGVSDRATSMDADMER